MKYFEITKNLTINFFSLLLVVLMQHLTLGQDKKTAQGDASKEVTVSQQGKQPAISGQDKKTAQGDASKEVTVSQQGKQPAISGQDKKTAQGDASKEVTVSQQGKQPAISGQDKKTAQSDAKEVTGSQQGKQPAISGREKKTAQANVSKEAKVIKQEKRPVISGKDQKAALSQKKEEAKEVKQEEKPGSSKAPAPSPKQTEFFFIPTLDEKKESDKAFLEWKIRDPYSSLSKALKKALTSDAIGSIVDQAQIDGDLNEQEVQEKILSLADSFSEEFGEHIRKQEVYTLLKQIILPPRIFERMKDPELPQDVLYADFLKVLRGQITPIDTTLEEWALRFLTSESILIALPIIEAIDVGGRSFSTLTPNEQKRELESVIDVVTQRFLTNLEAVQQKFTIPFPGRMDEVLRNKISHFFYEKFVSALQ